MRTPCFQHDAYRAECGDCREMSLRVIIEASGREEAMSPLEAAASRLGATPAEGIIPGLWNVPGHPELTSGQLLDLASRS